LSRENKTCQERTKLVKRPENKTCQETREQNLSRDQRTKLVKRPENKTCQETREQNLSTKDGYVGLWFLTPLSTIFHLYRDVYVYVLGMKLVRFIKRVDTRTSIKHTELCSSGIFKCWK
jgi:hypothetical protein